MEPLTHDELVLMLGRLTGTLHNDEKRQAIVTMLLNPEPFNNDRVGAYLAVLRNQLTRLLREGGIEKGTP